jgi:23S rRNA (guanosine2251-2'-O)-methyltransferase
MPRPPRRRAAPGSVAGGPGPGAGNAAGPAAGAADALAGFHAVEARLRSDPASIEALVFDAGRRDARMLRLLERAAQAGVRCIPADAARLDSLTEAAHQGVVARAAARRASLRFEDLLDAVGPETFLLLLDGVTDPRNLGACLRTAAAAGVQAVVVPRDRSASLGAVAAKTAAGAAETLPLVTVTNLARAMKEMQDAGIWIVGADVDAPRSLYEVDLTGPRAWALGSEGSGLRRLTRERCDELAFIPMAGGMESLNVSVAAGVCLFETQRQRRAAADRNPGA